MEISFSYIITFISLIYGLALAHSLSCIAEYIQHWKQIKHYWVWWFWAIFLILLSVGFWISIYAFYSKIEKWVVADFFFLTFQSANTELLKKTKIIKYSIFIITDYYTS